MRVLLIHCHPRAESFSAALRDTARQALEAAGHQVECRDLYAEGFSAALSDAEHRDYLDPASNPSDVADHVASLQRADALLLVYPTWWYGLPAMLKGWFDRIWAPGVAFKLGDGAIEPLLTNIKRIGVVTTYGSPLWLLWVIGWPDKKLINRGIRRLCARGCRVEWLMLTLMDQRTAPERAAFLAKVKARLRRW
ncbi:MAG: NAD(P)H-dependent oxidoreductase [Roseomonas sp.]|nr:NAD(P)H-dependent oxidoreductase [Roseomonas sp.]MCA3317935.1 NAD(P)H-dependent oxidoreductase [Roseomonas sp.]MCA3320444.1 NAD(P)H-dependent oxidoreductase [Roseomonas sp.]